MPSQRAIIKPALLAWAREEAGLSVEEAAKRIAVKPEHLLACEQSEDHRLTVRQLRILSNAYRRPLAFFYLPQPPPKSTILRDFRRPAQEAPEPESPKLRYEIRRARYRRRVALDLFEELGQRVPEFTAKASLQDNTFDVAARLRALLGVEQAQQRDFKDEYEALNTWRAAIEKAGVAVFQASEVDSKEMLGFSLSEPLLPVIVLNMGDLPVRRIFTMMHEMAHLMLRTDGLCVLKEVQEIEVFCNEVAGEALVPQAWLLDEPMIKDRGRRRDWSDDTIQTLGTTYRVSRETIVRRLLVANYATKDFYELKREQYKAEYEALQKATALKREAARKQGKDKQGFAPPSTIAVGEAGRMFVHLVLESYRQEKITLADVSDFLEVRTKHLDKIAKAVQNPTLKLGAA